MSALSIRKALCAKAVNLTASVIGNGSSSVLQALLYDAEPTRQMYFYAERQQRLYDHFQAMCYYKAGVIQSYVQITFFTLVHPFFLGLRYIVKQIVNILTDRQTEKNN